MEDVSLSAGMAVLLESSMVAGGGMERRALEELTWTLSHQMHNAISQPPGDAATSPAMQLPKRHKVGAGYPLHALAGLPVNCNVACCMVASASLLSVAYGCCCALCALQRQQAA